MTCPRSHIATKWQNQDLNKRNLVQVDVQSGGQQRGRESDVREEKCLSVFHRRNGVCPKEDN